MARAYEVLSDPEKRRRYDAFGPEGVEGTVRTGSPFDFGGLGDVFEAFFGASPFGGGRRQSGPPRGEDLEVVADLDFTDAVFGCEHAVSVRTAVACQECNATGAAEGTQPVTCYECQGTGHVQRVRQSLIGSVVQSSPCARCGGSGEVIPSPCPRCGGEGRVIEERTYTVDIPAGVDTGSTLRLSGRGAAGPRGGRPGDLYVHLRVRPHPRFTRDGVDLHDDRAALHAGGAGHDAGARDARRRRAAECPGDAVGHDLPAAGPGRATRRRSCGDLLVTVVVEVPTELSEEEEECCAASPSCGRAGGPTAQRAVPPPLGAR